MDYQLPAEPHRGPACDALACVIRATNLRWTWHELRETADRLAAGLLA